ncbi:MAG: hypothetical protein ABSF70_09610 [Terracidiphilus sp.]|jgi:ABC-type phosphate transport system substrate-binding protein
MKYRSRILILVAALLLFGSVARAQVIVIVNPGVSADSVSKAALEKIFTGTSTRLGSGERVVPVLLKEGPVHSAFLSTYLGKSPIALIINWRSLVLSGQGSMPKSFDSEAEMVSYVARTPTAIGYIGEKTAHDSVKVLEVK